MTRVTHRIVPFMLVVAVTGSPGPLSAAEATPPAGGAGAAPAAANRSEYERSPYQLWPTEVFSARGIVVSGSKLASKAGAAVLEAGGNAVDAAVATAFALGVTEPMTSGLGAETLILIYLRDGRTVAIDGSCYVPFLANPDELQRARATAQRGYFQGYRSAATPGSLAALAYAIKRHGTKSLAEVLTPAIELAEFGYTLSATGHAEVEGLASYLRPHEHVADLLLKDFTGTWDPDHVYCSSDLAKTLRRIAGLGADEFYHGRIADDIDADMTRNGGYIRKADLAAVRAVERQTIRDSYRGFEVITFPYPGGGGSLMEVLHILETFPKEILEEASLDRLHLLIEAARIAWVDNQDSRMPPALLDRQLTDRRWAAQRAKLIRFDRALLPSEIGGNEPARFLGVGTTQVSVVDRWGNVVGLSQTLGGFFGAGEITPGLGFIYNANMNTFNFTNPKNPYYVAPGRAAVTALTPTIIVKDGKPLLVLGSAGSERVIPSMAAVISQIADRGVGLCEAVAAPRAIWGTNWGDPRAFVELAGEITPERAEALEKRGFQGMFLLKFPGRLVDLAAFGGTNAVYIDPRTGMLEGVPDPRRSGFAAAPGGH